MLNHRYLRRLVTFPVIILIAVGMTVLVPIAIPLALVFDLVRGEMEMPWARLWLMGIVYAWNDVFWLVLAFGVWIAAGFGMFIRRDFYQRTLWWMFFNFMTFVLWFAKKIIRLDFELTDRVGDTSGPIVFFSRHASMADVLFPAKVLIDKGIRPVYVLKKELLIEPIFDLVGNWQPHHFVDRSGANTEAELEALGKLASAADSTQGLIIFPEGTRFTQSKRTRILTKLSERRPDIAEQAQQLTHTLPPRYGGPNALLEACPDRKLLVLVHFGLDHLDSFKILVRSVPFEAPIKMELYEVDVTSLPFKTQAREKWLLDLWSDVDDWVAGRAEKQVAEKQNAPGPGS